MESTLPYHGAYPFLFDYKESPIMTLTFRYSVQPATMKPEGFTGKYGRLQVDYRQETDKIVVPATEYDKLTKALAEGRVIGLTSNDGRDIGQFLPSLSRGFDIASFKQATVDDLRVGFRPTHQLLVDTRSQVTFERIPTVVNDLAIMDITFTYYTGATGRGQTRTILTNQIKLDQEGILKVKGVNFVKNGMTIKVSQSSGNFTEFTIPSNSGTQFSEAMVSSGDLSGTLYTAGRVEIEISRNDNPDRKGSKTILFVV